MKIYVKQLYDEKGEKIPITLPVRASSVAAGYDIVATSDPKIVGEADGILWKRVDYIEYETNLYIAPSAVTFHTLVHPRSSVSKYNLVLANSIGLVDNDYRGMVICRFKYSWQPEDFKAIIKDAVIEFSDSTKIPIRMATGEILGTPNLNKIYKKGDTIAQLVIESTIQAEWELVDDLSQTQRGEGGFGSTDVTKSDSTSKTSLEDMYNKLGGVVVREKYTEELKKRDQI